MITAELKNSTGEIVALQIPENGHEVKLGQALDFDLKCMDLFDWLKENSDDFEKKKGQYLFKVIDCLNVFYLNIVDFFGLSSEYIDKIDSNTINDQLKVFNGKYNTDQAIDSIMGIFNMIYLVVKNTKPELSESKIFEFKGSKFTIPHIWIDRINNVTYFPSPTVKQAIETLNIIAWYEDIQESKEFNSKVKIDNLYHKYLTELAILLIEEGKEIPTDETQFKIHMEEMRTFFEDIDLQTALNIEHWFKEYYKSLKEDRENHYYFNTNEKNYPKNGEELEALNRAKSANEDIFKKIGFKSVIKRLLELAAFQGSRKTAIESVNNAPFTDAVKLISIDNSD